MDAQAIANKAILQPMQAHDIKEHLSKFEVGNISSIEVISTLTSTNDYLLQEKVLKQSKCAVCVAEEQTQGRGRFGHQWSSPMGVNLYLSLLWPLKQWRQQYEMLGLLLLTSIAEMLEQLDFADIQLKWPNDICIHEKKLGGILIDKKLFQSVHNLIIGVGINVAMSTLKNNAVHTPWVDLISYKPEWEMSRNELAAHVIFSITQALSKLENYDHVNLPLIWRRYDLMYQRQIEFSYNKKRNIGMALGIDEQGQIIIELDGKALHLHSSHVSDITL